MSPVRAGPYISLCFIRTSSRQATVVSPLKWNTLLLSHLHDYIYWPIRALPFTTVCFFLAGRQSQQTALEL
jgi:hypothetical protein